MDAIWAGRSLALWDAFTQRCVNGRGRRLRVHEPSRGRWAGAAAVGRVAAWPLSQVIWCASAIEALEHAGQPAVARRWQRGTGANSHPPRTQLPVHPDAEELWTALQWYRSGEAYLDHRPRGKRYYDDNAWLGLVAAQQGLLSGQPRWWARAAEIARFVAAGHLESGGVYWVEPGDTVNACSTGSGGLLFAALALESPLLTEPQREAWAARAGSTLAFLAGPLLRDDGLVADHVRADGTVEPSVWAYNQGLLLQIAARNGDGATADAIEAAVARGLPPAVLARQPATFACIWLRSLLAHRALAGSDEAPEVADYLERAWARGRAADGLLRGVSRYDDGLVLDHVSVAGLAAAYAGGPEVWSKLL